MAITLNKYAIQCEQIALDGGRISTDSSARPLLYDISRNWRQLIGATGFRSDHVCRWTEKEEMAGEVIVSAMTYLQRIGCGNIEQLLKDIIERHANQK